MKKITLFITLIISYNVFSHERIKASNEAGEKFLNWHFFENGRGMTLTPNLSRYMWMLKQDTSSTKKSYFKKIKDPVSNFMQDRYGFTFNKGKIQGIFNVKYKGMQVGVLGCTACHSGRAAGVLVPGLGNKTIDPYIISRDAKRIQKFWGRFNRDPDFLYIKRKAENFAKVSSDKKIANLTRGLVSDNAINTFFYKDIGEKYPIEKRAQVKVPHLWGIKEKQKAGIFNEGALSGENYAWIFGAELFGSDSGEHLRASLNKIKYLTDEILAKLLPPKYPFEISYERAQKGRKVFERTCMKCHGPHQKDQDGLPIYKAPKVIPQHVVKTDANKLNVISDEFISVVKRSSLGDILFFNEDKIRKGYFAPKLWGVWARFPYLHNGSVPNLWALLTPPDKRPEVFSMKDAGEEYRFDKKLLGLTLIKNENMGKALFSAKKGNRNLYYVKRDGQANSGHYFKKFKLLTNQDKVNLIEYLKTL